MRGYYEVCAIKFCRELQKVEKHLDLEAIKLIRSFKTNEGYSIPVSLEEGSGSMLPKWRENSK